MKRGVGMKGALYALIVIISISGRGILAAQGDAESPEIPVPITRLYEAVRAGDMQKMRTLLHEGVDLRHPACTGLLHTAVEFDNADSLRQLLESGMHANERPVSYNGETALHMAVSKGKQELVNLLLDGGALPDLLADEALTQGLTPLHYAVIGNDLLMVKLLLDRGASVSTTSFDGRSTLYIAVQQGRYRVVHLLLARGVSVQAGDASGDTPLHAAVELAAGECGADSQDANDPEACRSCLVRLLLRNGAGVNARGTGGNSPLHTAIGRNCLEIVKLLIGDGADVYARNDRGDSPLLVAYREEKTEIIAYFRAIGTRFDADPGLVRFQAAQRHYEFERRQTELFERFLYVGLPIAYVAGSIYLREFHYRYAPQNNPLAPVHGIAAAAVYGCLGGGLLGVALGFPFGSDTAMVILGLTGAVAGIIGGIYLGARNVDGIERGRVLYYSGTSLVLLVPLFYLQF
ncbi:MAG: hypothetical protein EPN93_04905 [Spirochaetes bacterium]|nr:MAG: hypothetical protein EPN93_04905 [Spirochaetota bacterium]